MNSVRSRLVRRCGVLLGILVVTVLGGACAPGSSAETPGQVVLAPSAPATPDAAATISANLSAPVDAVPVMLPTATPPAPTPTPAPTATPTGVPTAVPTATPTPLLEPTPDGVVRTARIPILMYHYISTPPPGADVYRVDLSTAPDLFGAQLDRLQAEGYTTISLYRLIDYLTRGAPLPEKPIVLTFDDGYRDNYEHAFPLLQERGMKGTFFVVTDFIDEQRPDYLSWDMAREMLAAGHSIESHGRNHFTLEGQDDDYLVWQALGSLETLQYELGVRPRFVSYPAGDYDARTIAIFQSANYWAGLTTEQGTEQSSDRPFELARIRMRNTTTPDDLLRYIRADW